MASAFATSENYASMDAVVCSSENPGQDASCFVQRALVIACFPGVGEDYLSSYDEIESLPLVCLLPGRKGLGMSLPRCAPSPSGGDFYYGWPESSDDHDNNSMSCASAVDGSLASLFSRHLLDQCAKPAVVLVPDGIQVLHLLRDLHISFIHVLPTIQAESKWRPSNLSFQSSMEIMLGEPFRLAVSYREKYYSHTRDGAVPYSLAHCQSLHGVIVAFCAAYRVCHALRDV